MPAADETSIVITPELRAHLAALQSGEMTEYHIYRNLARSVSDSNNRAVLEQMANEEAGHAAFWKGYTGREEGPNRVKVAGYTLISRVFGLTFGIKLMERRESEAVGTYRRISAIIPEAAAIVRNEEEHEARIIGLLDEQRLRYLGSIVLGINDALVEFTGSLAGFTLALQDTRLIAATGLIMGIAASLSMGSSEYLARKSEGLENPLAAALYTGGAYVATVMLLILPFLLMAAPLQAYAVTLVAAVLVIMIFTFYTSVAKDLPFLKRFGEMAAISLGIAAISFVIGILVRTYLNVQV